jgi:hypothetical protein
MTPHHRTIKTLLAVAIAISMPVVADAETSCDPALEHFHLCRANATKPSAPRLDAFGPATTATPAAAAASLPMRPVVVTPDIETWTTQFPTLFASFDAWAKKAGYTLMWNAGTDRNLPAPLQYRGTFEEATTRVFELYRKEKNPLFVNFHIGGVQRLVIVTDTLDPNASHLAPEGN